MNEQQLNPVDGNGAAGEGSDTLIGSAAMASEVEAPVDDSPAPAKPFSFAQMLVEAGVLSAEQIEKAQEAAQRERLPLGQVLVRDGLILSRDLATLTVLHLGLPMVDLRNETIDPAIVVLLPQEIARRYLVLPVRESDGRLTVAMTDPTDLQTIQDLTTRTGRKIDPVIATPEDIQENIDLSYRAAEREAQQSS